MTIKDEPKRAPEPERYLIQKLLDEAVQPWDAATDEEIEALANGIGRKTVPLAVPVTMGSHGRVVQGSQRLRALQKLGRKYIAATDVRIVPQITSENELEWAVKLQAVQRQLDIPAKARVVRMLMAKNGWSQNRCAKAFGVSPAAVSQWLGQSPAGEDEEELPDEVRGEDGVVQNVEQKRRRRRLQRTGPHPWTQEGECVVLVRKVTSRIQGAVTAPQTWENLSMDEREGMLAALQDLEGMTADLIALLSPE